MGWLHYLGMQSLNRSLLNAYYMQILCAWKQEYCEQNRPHLQGVCKLRGTSRWMNTTKQRLTDAENKLVVTNGKSEGDGEVQVLVSQSYLTLGNPMDWSLSGYSFHGLLQARICEWVAIPFPRGIFPTQGSNPGFPHCRQILYCLRDQGSSRGINY